MSASIAGQGLRADNWQQPGRQAAQFSRLPVLLADPAPAVATAVGFGSGGGAGIGRGATSAYGLVRIRVGLAAAASGTVSLLFANPIPAARAPLFVAADWAAIALSGTNPYVFSWTATRPLIPGEHLAIAYQWSVMT